MGTFPNVYGQSNPSLIHAYTIKDRITLHLVVLKIQPGRNLNESE